MRGMTISALLAAVLTALGSCRVHAVTIGLHECQPIAEATRVMAEMRDVGADREKYLALLRAKARAASYPPERMKLLELQLRRVYALPPDADPEAIEQAVFQWCIQNLGDMGDDT